MPNEYARTSDAASIILPHHHTLNILHGHVAALKTPAELYGHTAEELLDLARTRHHGGDFVLDGASLHEALSLARNAVRMRVWDPDGNLKHLSFGANCRTNAGGYQFMQAITGDLAAGYFATITGTASAVGATSLTNSTASFPASTGSQHGTGLVGRIVQMGAVYGVILNNTGTVLTIDQWYNPASASGAAGSNPALGEYLVLPGQAPSRWIAVSTDSTTEDIGNTTLTSEQSTGFSSNPRWFGTSTVTAAPSGTGTANATATEKVDSGVQTYTGAGVTIAKVGLFQGQNGGELTYVKKLASSAVLATNDTVDASEAASYA